MRLEKHMPQKTNLSIYDVWNRDNRFTEVVNTYARNGIEAPSDMLTGLTEKQIARYEIELAKAQKKPKQQQSSKKMQTSNLVNTAYGRMTLNNAAHRCIVIDDATLNRFSKSQRKKYRQLLKKAQKQKSENELASLIPQTEYRMSFDGARSHNRKFIVHVGPTNSGKTHDAIEALEKADTGVYLAPLRLLALEIGERLRDDGIRTSIVTGEEMDIDEIACHISSTVEMLNINEHYDVAVIDEAQMLGDKERGTAWTRAIVGVDADVIHICTALNARDIVVRLIEMCGDSYDIIEHERQTPLIVTGKWDGNVEKGDAYICFSRKNVLATASDFEDKGYKSSLVYGALPWQARRLEAEKFRDGKTDIVVATDAIGMGMNLPIKRVVFLEDKKYDGTSMRFLKSEEYKQIAGRAGRLGMYDEGYCCAANDKGNERLRDGIESPSEQVSTAYVSFPESLGMLTGFNLSTIMSVWSKRPNIGADKGILTKRTSHDAIEAARWMETTGIDKRTSRRNELSMCTVPFDWDNDDQRQLWQKLVKNYVSCSKALLPGGGSWNSTYGRKVSDNLSTLEQQLKDISLTFSFARAMEQLTPDMISKFADVRMKIYRKVIEKLDGPKRMLGYYTANYWRADDADRRRSYYDDDDWYGGYGGGYSGYGYGYGYGSGWGYSSRWDDDSWESYMGSPYDKIPEYTHRSVYKHGVRAIKDEGYKRYYTNVLLSSQYFDNSDIDFEKFRENGFPDDVVVEPFCSFDDESDMFDLYGHIYDNKHDRFFSVPFNECGALKAMRDGVLKYIRSDKKRKSSYRKMTTSEKLVGVLGCDTDELNLSKELRRSQDEGKSVLFEHPDASNIIKIVLSDEGVEEFDIHRYKIPIKWLCGYISRKSPSIRDKAYTLCELMHLEHDNPSTYSMFELIMRKAEPLHDGRKWDDRTTLLYDMISKIGRDADIDKCISDMVHDVDNMNDILDAFMEKHYPDRYRDMKRHEKTAQRKRKKAPKQDDDDNFYEDWD